jgi:hypothetical protein
MKAYISPASTLMHRTIFDAEVVAGSPAKPESPGYGILEQTTVSAERKAGISHG